MGTSMKRRWRALFGATPYVCAKVWILIDTPNNKRLPSNAQRKHLMWALLFLREYEVEESHACLTGVDEDTFRKWQKIFVEELTFLECRIILWKDRKVNDIYNDALTSVDGTDISVPNYKPFWKGWYSHKINKAGVRWEVALCLRTGEIVWIHGPFPCGRWPDLLIFRHAMISHMDDDERAEADDGYIGEPTKTLTPKRNTRNESDADFRQYTRNRQETINARLKDWSCLSGRLRHSLGFHSAMFCAVAVLCQLAIQSGEPLFQIDYDQENFMLPFPAPTMEDSEE